MFKLSKQLFSANRVTQEQLDNFCFDGRWYNITIKIRVIIIICIVNRLGHCFVDGTITTKRALAKILVLSQKNLERKRIILLSKYETGSADIIDK